MTAEFPRKRAASKRQQRQSRKAGRIASHRPSGKTRVVGRAIQPDAPRVNGDSLKSLARGIRLRTLEKPEEMAAWSKLLGDELPKVELKRLRNEFARLRRLTCSETWADDAWERNAPYPPGGCQTLMVPCKSEKCSGRLYPPQFIGSSGHCWDCRVAKLPAWRARLLPGSTSTINIAKVKSAIRRGEQPQGGI